MAGVLPKAFGKIVCVLKADHARDGFEGIVGRGEQFARGAHARFENQLAYGAAELLAAERAQLALAHVHHFAQAAERQLRGVMFADQALQARRVALLGNGEQPDDANYTYIPLDITSTYPE